METKLETEERLTKKRKYKPECRAKQAYAQIWPAK
ncbi:hypothetical protein CCACVL1_24564, partial [Corchorus capsularis]